MNVWKKIHWQHYLGYAVVAAIIYCIPVIIYLIKANYTYSWLLYLGNLLFLFVITAFLFSFNKRRKQDASTVTMLIAGHIVTGIGVAVACVLCTILLLVFVPGIWQPGPPENVLSGSPANTIKDNTGGMSFMLFANAIIGNVSAGSAAAIIFPFVLKRNQIKEEVPRKQAEL